MIPGKILPILIVICLSASALNSCKKAGTSQGDTGLPTTHYSLKYPDSVLYLKNQSDDYIVSPVESKSGKYFGYPEGIEINQHTGAINVNKSEPGLRYRITFVSTAGDTSSTLLIISGITFTDQFYKLSAGDSLANPIYNASLNNILPLSGSIFDEGNGANSGGCAMKTDNGKINLAESIRNGVFGSNHPSNDAKKDVDIVYRLNDKSGKVQNKLKIRLYYYATMADVAPDLLQTLKERQDDAVFIGPNSVTASAASLNSSGGHAKPRPPCVIIIAN